MADAEISEVHPVLNGIKQGCPLAPTLSVLAVDTLYQAIEANTDIPGIQLPNGNMAALEPLFDLLGQFAEASGLEVSREKCVAIALHDIERPSIDLGLPLAAATDMNQLLGGQVSSQAVNAKTWDLTLQQLRTRMRMAEIKTTNVLQRVKLTKAVVIPKFTFIAHHHWPNNEQVARAQRLIHNFVWHGSRSEGPSTRRAWMNAAVAALPPTDGGLGMPRLTHVLQELSVQVVARWATPNHGLRSIIGKICLQHHKAPEGAKRASRRSHTKPTLQRPDTQLFLHDAFSLRLNTIPSKLWTRPEISRLPKPTPDDTSATHQAVQTAWRMLVLSTLHIIWRWRTDTEVRDEIWSSAQARAYHDRCLRAILVDVRWKSKENSAASSHTAAALEILRSSDPENEFPPTSTSAESERRYILFFDGGSRGNPGPGGSGAVIVSTNQVATAASIIWSAAMSSVKPTTTTNQAEYRGVLEGLRAAQNHRWLPLDVVGDSQLILGQLRQYRPPRNQQLRVLYAEARRLGDQLGVRRWTHHLRAFNKMADAAANAAMNTRTSSQVHHPTNRADHAALAEHLGMDFAHWQAHHYAHHIE